MGTADIWTGTGSSQRRPGAGGGALGDESCWTRAAGEAPDDAPDVEVRAQGRARGVLDSATRSSTCSVQSEAWRAGTDRPLREPRLARVGFQPPVGPLAPSLSPWGQESCTPTPDGPTNPTFSAPHVLEPLPWTHLSPAPARRSRLPKELSSPELGATWLSPSGCHGSAGSPPPGAPSTSHWPLSGAQPRGPPAGDEALGRRARSVWRLALRFLRAQEAEVSQRAGGAAGCTPPWGARTPCPCPFRRDSPCPRGGPSPFCGYKKSVSERSWFQLAPRPVAGP